MPYFVNEVAAALAAHDLPLLQVSRRVAPPPRLFEPAALIETLLSPAEPRYSALLIALFLRHPSYASVVPALDATLPSEAAERLRHLYTAAVYLQQLWRNQLLLDLGQQAELPDYYGQAVWQLPPPSVHFGEAGLRELASQMQAQSGFNWISSYENAISHLLTYLRLEAFRAA